MSPERLLEHYETFSEAEDAVSQLRQFILELAVRGKLVEQNSEDEPVQIPIERGQETESFQKASEVESVPLRGWRRVFLGRLISLRKGKKPKVLNAAGRGLPYLDIAALERGDLRQFTEDAKCPRAAADDLVIVCDGSRSGLVLDGRDGVLGSTVAAIQFNGFTRGYLRVLLNALYEDLNGSKKGAAIPHLNIPRLLSLEIGLPPPAEQHRIVAKVDELMALCDELEAARTKRETRRNHLVSATLHRLNNGDASPEASNGSDFKETARFYFNHLPRLTARPEHIKQLRQTILNLAVRGKLVLQELKDEPVSKLLETIDQERAGVAKTDRRADATLQELLAMDTCWDIPGTWKWRGVADLALFIDYRGKTPVKSISGIRLITAKNVRRGFINLEPEEFITEKTYKSWMTRGLPKVGDILLTTEAPMGNASVVRLHEKFGLAQRVINFRLYGKLDPDFIVLQLLSEPFQAILDKTATGVTAKGIKAAKLKRLPLAVPPLAEQRRIVAKVDELMSLCDELEAQLTTTATTRRRLLEATLHEALGSGLAA